MVQLVTLVTNSRPTFNCESLQEDFKLHEQTVTNNVGPHSNFVKSHLENCLNSESQEDPSLCPRRCSGEW